MPRTRAQECSTTSSPLAVTRLTLKSETDPADHGVGKRTLNCGATADRPPDGRTMLRLYGGPGAADAFTPTAFWRSPPVHRGDLEGKRRVEAVCSPCDSRSRPGSVPFALLWLLSAHRVAGTTTGSPRRNTTLRLFAGIPVITGAENPTDCVRPQPSRGGKARLETLREVATTL
jgi:hypothetical protein